MVVVVEYQVSGGIPIIHTTRQGPLSSSVEVVSLVWVVVEYLGSEEGIMLTRMASSLAMEVLEMDNNHHH